MRPQGFGQMGMGLEDLGWNDMGHSQQPAPEQDYAPPAEHVPSSISALTPSPRHNGFALPAQEAARPAEPVSPPPVVEQQRAVAQAFTEKKEEQPRPRAVRARRTSGSTRSAPGEKAKAAFTLRVDPERHLKLRLACAVSHRSAQQIVTEALDKFLASLPEVEAMASRVPAKSGAK